MPNMFHAQIDLNLLADKLAPLIAARLADSDRRGVTTDRQATDDWPDEPTGDADEDPWADESTGRENRSQGRSGPRSGNSGRSSGGSSRGNSSRGGGRSSGGRNGSDIPDSGQHEDAVGKLWEFGLSDAPECNCGMTAAEVTKPRAKWRAWACPKGFSKTQYRNKCDLWEYQD